MLNSQKGFAHILGLLLLVVGLGVSVYLVQQKTNLFPKAYDQSQKGNVNSIIAEEKKVAELDRGQRFAAEAAKIISLQQKSLTATPSSKIKLTSPTISSCGEITSSGNYFLTQDASASGMNCISIHDTNDVNLDCQNHAIKTSFNPDSGAVGIALNINNVQNFSIRNCLIQAFYRTDRYKYINSPSLRITNSSGGSIQNNTIGDGHVCVLYCNNLQLLSNTLNTYYYQGGSSSNTIFGNTIKITGAYVADMVGLYGGENNIIENNVVDGAWDGNDMNIGTLGADNGILLDRQSGALVRGNTISNNYCSGIETIGFTNAAKILNNKINNSGLNGIGGWHHFTWLNNDVEGNIIDGSAYMFYIFVARWDRSNPVLYFENNTFTNNTFLHQRSSSYIGLTKDYSSMIDLQNMPVGANAPSTVQAGNNTFKNNDFNQMIPSPVLIPTTMIVDQGGNKCLPGGDISLRPLSCTSICKSNSDCPSGYKCQIQACTQRYCPDNNPNCNTCPGKCVPVRSKPTPTPTATASVSVSVSCSACGANIRGDGKVSITDIMIVARCMGMGASGSVGQYSCQKADVNGDGKIDASDLNCARQQFGKQCTGPR